MPPDKDTIDRFQERYSIPATEAALAVEEEVVGGNVGANGYTTLAQAHALIRELRLRPEMRLLDIGAGRGWPGLYVAGKTACEVVLVDIPLPGLAAAVKRADEQGLGRRSTVVMAAAERLPFQTHTFDAIVHTDVL